MFRQYLLALLVFSAFQHTFGQTVRPVLVIHGGAGAILRENMTPEMEKRYHRSLENVLLKGDSILSSGGSALDAVETCIRMMEDDSLFNAGRGAVFTHDGKNELDASIMDGKTMKAGAVAGITCVKHPITAARKVMENSSHVMLSGKGAEEFCRSQKLEMVDPSWFRTQMRWNQLQEFLDAEKKNGNGNGAVDTVRSRYKFGTVGVVALDQTGNLAAGTSTGGITNKKWGRIGDSPVIGAGTYASNNSCAISCTGQGEFFIRYAVAHDVSARMIYLQEDVRTAAETVVMHTLSEAGGLGGLIALDVKGNFAMPFNTPGMYRGYMRSGEKPVTAIFKDE